MYMFLKSNKITINYDLLLLLLLLILHVNSPVHEAYK